MPESKKKYEDFSSGFLFFVNEEHKVLRIFLLTLFSQVATTQKLFELESSHFLTFLTNTFPSLKAKSWALIPTALFLRHTA